MKKTIVIVLILIFVLQVVVHAQGSKEKVVIYSDNFAGNNLELGIGKYDYMYLVRQGNMLVRSIKVPQGMRAILYEKDNFEGASIMLTDNTSQAQLESKGFGKITMNVSIVVEKIPAGELPAAGTFVTIFKDDFAGASRDLVAGKYDFNDLGAIGNDQLSSVRVPKGMKITLYEHGNFKGRTLSFTSDVNAATLKGKNFNDVASGIFVEQVVVEQKATEKDPVIVPVVKDSAVAVPSVSEPTLKEPVEPLIYEGDFSGPSKSLSPGRYSRDKLGIANNELSSIKVPKGFRVTLYDGDAFEGRSMVLTSDTRAAVFVDNNFNNLTSSLLVEALPMVTLYEGDYGGVSARLLPGRYAGHNFGIGNDQLSSVRVPRGLKVTIYQDENFGGASLTLLQDSGTDVLTANSFNNETSSLTVEEIIEEKAPSQTIPPVPAVTIYADRFSGRSQVLAPGRYSLKLITIGNDQVSSAVVPPGLRLILFEDDDFKGYSITAENNIDLTISKVFNKRASSAIVEEIVVKAEVPQAPEKSQPEQQVDITTVSTQQTPSCELSTAQFESAYKSIESKSFMEEKMSAARLTTKGRCLTILQIRSIAKLFMSDDQSLEFVKYAYDRSMEKEDFYLLEDVFKFMSTKESFTKFLAGK